MSMEAYPKRESYYAMHLTRLLRDSGAAQIIGRDACLLVVYIASQEDDKRYEGPVTYWNSQLDNAMGFRSRKQLIEARKAAIDAGWLHYRREHDRSVGVYWTDIPSDSCSAGGTQAKDSCSAGGAHSGSRNGTPSYPDPDPNKDMSLNDVQVRDCVSYETKKAKSARRQKPTPQRFEEFWKAYPVRKEKKAAITHYAKAVAAVVAEQGIDSVQAESHIIQAAGRYASECRASGTAYIKNPATWLHKGCYADEPASAAAPAQVELLETL